jgi:hypothetical protein
VNNFTVRLAKEMREITFLEINHKYLLSCMYEESFSSRFGIFNYVFPCRYTDLFWWLVDARLRLHGGHEKQVDFDIGQSGDHTAL